MNDLHVEHLRSGYRGISLSEQARPPRIAQVAVKRIGRGKLKDLHFVRPFIALSAPDALKEPRAVIVEAFEDPVFISNERIL